MAVGYDMGKVITQGTKGTGSSNRDGRFAIIAENGKGPGELIPPALPNLRSIDTTLLHRRQHPS